MVRKAIALRGTGGTWTCKDWCDDHADGAAHLDHTSPEDQLCQRRFRGEYGEILLTFTLDEGPMVNLFGGVYEMRLPAARAFLADFAAAVELAEQSAAK